MRFSIALFMGALLLSSCAEPADLSISASQQEALISQSRTASRALMSTLQVQLKSAIQKEGAAGAVSTCSVIAPAIASQVSKEHGLQIRRVSAKPRNPESQPDAFESEQLQKWLSAESPSLENPQEIEVHKLVEQDGKLHFRYLKPIRIQQACLQCHGEALSPQVKAAIQEKYPGDLATGYALNDLRGAVSVSIEIPQM